MPQTTALTLPLKSMPYKHINRSDRGDIEDEKYTNPIKHTYSFLSN